MLQHPRVCRLPVPAVLERVPGAGGQRVPVVGVHRLLELQAGEQRLHGGGGVVAVGSCGGGLGEDEADVLAGGLAQAAAEPLRVTSPFTASPHFALV